MAIKPTEVTDWANSGSALKTATDSNRWNLGWQTLPDNLPNQTGERPNLNQQNYWQNAVHLWITYFDSLIPSGETTVTEDLWRWVTSDIHAANDQIDPYLDSIANVSGKLQWNYSLTGGYDFSWEDTKQELYHVARIYETYDMFAQGISIQIVDGGGDVWTIIPTGDITGQDWANEINTTWLNFQIDPNEQDDTYNNINPAASGNTMFTIRRDAFGGGTTFPSDFTDFTTLNSSNFNTQNPNGVRAVLHGLESLSHTFNASAPTRKPVKRYIRGLNMTDPSYSPFDGSVSGRYNLYVNVIQGKRYRITANGGLPSPALLNGTFVFEQITIYQNDIIPRNIQYQVATPVMINCNNGSNRESYFNGVWEFTATLSTDLDVSFEGLANQFGFNATDVNKFRRQDYPKIIVEEID